MYVRRTVTIFSHVGAYNISVDIDEEKSRPNMLLSYHDNRHYNSVYDQSNIGNNHNNNQDVSIQSNSGSQSNSRKKERTKKKKNRNEYSDEAKTNNVLECNDNSNGHEDPMDKDHSAQHQRSKTDVAEEVKKKNVPRKNDICSCGSGLRYKKCCLAKEKTRIRLEKFRERHGINVEDEEKINDEYTEPIELDSGFAILNI